MKLKSMEICLSVMRMVISHVENDNTNDSCLVPCSEILNYIKFYKIKPCIIKSYKITMYVSHYYKIMKL